MNYTYQKLSSIAIFITVVQFCLSFSLKAMSSELDSTVINIDKRNQLVLNSKNTKGSLREDLELVFSKHGVMLDDETWKQIRGIVNSDLDKDTVIVVSNGGRKVQIGFKNIAFDKFKKENTIVTKSKTDTLFEKRTERVLVTPEGRVDIGNIHVDPDGTVDVGNIHINSNGTVKIHKKDSLNHFANRAGFNLYFGLNTFGGTSSIAGNYNATNFELSPLGSRYFGMGFVRSTTLSQTATKSFRLSYGVELSWQNYMFENNTVLTKGTNSISFYTYQDDNGKQVALSRNKLTIASLMLPVMPYIAFKKSSFIQFVGLGGYLGYRIDSYTKTKEDDSGHKQWNHNSFFLNPIRYGVSFELGIKALPVLFFNYDLSNVFQNDKGPKINGINFGIRI
ncbi:MAG: outer membrane beta-barrel protein [Flectobacillus sp.]|nr:outer membrane beta-barrel protein [Flectobacillus sp.]